MIQFSAIAPKDIVYPLPLPYPFGIEIDIVVLHIKVEDKHVASALFADSSCSNMFLVVRGYLCMYMKYIWTYMMT